MKKRTFSLILAITLLLVIVLSSCGEALVGSLQSVNQSPPIITIPALDHADELDEPDPPRPPNPPQPPTPGLPNPPQTPNPPDPNNRQIAITFDDGPSVWTSRILDRVEGMDNVRLTFFVLGNRLHNQTNRDILLRAHNMGHEIGNHSYSHRNFTTANDAEIRRQLDNTSDIIQEITGTRPHILRPPYGAFSREVNYGYPVIIWNMDPQDWRNTATEDSIYQYIVDRMQNGSILLLHDIYERTYRAFSRALDTLLEQGYELVTVSELLGLTPGSHHGYYFRSTSHIRFVTAPVFDRRD